VPLCFPFRRVSPPPLFGPSGQPFFEVPAVPARLPFCAAAWRRLRYFFPSDFGRDEVRIPLLPAYCTLTLFPVEQSIFPISLLLFLISSPSLPFFFCG